MPERREVAISSPLVDELRETELTVFIRTLKEQFGVEAIVRAIDTLDDNSPKDRGFIDDETFNHFARIMGHDQQGIDHARTALWRVGVEVFYFPKTSDAQKVADRREQGLEIYEPDGTHWVAALKEIQLPDGNVIKLMRLRERDAVIDIEALKKLVASKKKISGIGAGSVALYQEIIDHYDSLSRVD